MLHLYFIVNSMDETDMAFDLITKFLIETKFYAKPYWSEEEAFCKQNVNNMKDETSLKYPVCELFERTYEKLFYSV